MAIPLTGSTGALFPRLGHLIGNANDLFAFQGGPATANISGTGLQPARVAQMIVDFNASPINSSVIDGIFQALANSQNAQTTWLNYLKGLASSLMIAMANQDTSLIQANLTNALTLLITQMNAASASVNASVPTAGAQTAVGSPTGNPTFVLGLKNGKGQTLQYMLAETLTFACTRDSNSGGAANQEPFSIVGAAAAANPLSYLWPAGSGVQTFLNLTDATQNTAGGNLLVNSGFDTFTTANVPDNWTLAVGTAGTTVFAGGSGNVYDSAANCLQFTGNGSELTSVTQAFKTATNPAVGAGGTPTIPAEDVNYTLNGWLKVSATPTTGVAEFALVDGAGTIINDDAGTPNSFTKALTGVSTTYVNVNGTFRLPAAIPAVVKLRIRLSTALDAAKAAYFDHFALAQPAQLYAGGPFVAGFSGSTKPALGDAWTFVMGQTWGKFQQGFQRLFNMTGLQLQLPNSGSPTVADSLVG